MRPYSCDTVDSNFQTHEYGGVSMIDEILPVSVMIARRFFIQLSCSQKKNPSIALRLVCALPTRGNFIPVVAIGSKLVASWVGR